jgi:uncharacterized repeat protein (TIGR01451 family)
MKQKLLLLALCSLCIASAKTTKKATPNPLIGVMMTTINNVESEIIFSINIKNTGDETLNGIYLTSTDNIDFSSFTPIASLQPGEEVNNILAYKHGGPFCYDSSQVTVHAIPASSTVEITDLSSDPNAYDINNLPGTYYNDFPTLSYYYNMVTGYQTGTYVDANHNSIVDVGDVINYTYTVFSNSGNGGVIQDNNAIIDNNYFLDSTPLTGIHYITQADVTLGYVYNYSSFQGFGPCDISGPFSNGSGCFSCPNPNGANFVIKLTSDLPNKISGTVKYNNNNDNCATGLSFPNRRITTTDGNYYYSTYTNTTGNYHILIPNVGTYNTSALTSLNGNFSSSPTSVNTISSGSDIDYANTDFCIGSAANYTDLSVNMFNINQAIPGNVATYRIVYTNHGSTSINGSIQLDFSGNPLSLNVALPSTDSATSSVLNWNFTNLLPFETRYINLSLNVFPTASVSQALQFIVTGNPATDDFPSDNMMSWVQLVRSSFDPNDKSVLEGNVIDIGQTGDYLHYVTRFQNTGNANATTVVIKETLDPKLDWDTFEPIASSHDSNIQIRNGNELTYTFSNIDLAYESANEPASHGWMAYRIKPKSNIMLYDIMNSSSDIYFDYNTPVTTNNVQTQVTALATTDFIKNSFLVYPNPATDKIIIESKTTIESNYEITDINGKLLLKGSTKSMQPIGISSLESGFYFLALRTNQGKATYKFIKK